MPPWRACCALLSAPSTRGCCLQIQINTCHTLPAARSENRPTGGTACSNRRDGLPGVLTVCDVVLTIPVWLLIIFTMETRFPRHQIARTGLLDHQLLPSPRHTPQTQKAHNNQTPSCIPPSYSSSTQHQPCCTSCSQAAGAAVATTHPEWPRQRRARQAWVCPCAAAANGMHLLWYMVQDHAMLAMACEVHLQACMPTVWARAQLSASPSALLRLSVPEPAGYDAAAHKGPNTGAITTRAQAQRLPQRRERRGRGARRRRGRALRPPLA
jgi:hypothetical protein